MSTIEIRSRLAVAVMVTVAACVPRPLPPEPLAASKAGYDFRSKGRIGGEVVSVDDVRANDAAFSGVHVLLRMERGTVSVLLGPRRFLDESDWAVVPGDTLDVTGVSTMYEGKPAFVATTLKKGKRELRLPEPAGKATGDADAGRL